MSNYTQVTFFAPKDALSSGNPSKLIKGAEVDPELSAIASAIATKYDSTNIADNATAAAGTSDSTLITPLKAKYLLQNGSFNLTAGTTIGGLTPVFTTRNVNTGGALTGGGALSADRTITLDLTALTNLPSGVDGANDLLLIYDTSAAAYKQVKPDTVYSGLSGAVPNSRTLTAGNGLTGGGDLSANRTFDVGAGTGISVAADTVGLDTASTRNTDHTAVSITAGTGLTGGGDISATRTLSVDRTVLYKTASTSRASTTTPTDDPHLITSSLPAGTYLVKVWGAFGTSGSNQGYFFRFGTSGTMRATNPDDSTAMVGRFGSNNASASSSAGNSIQLGSANYPSVGMGNASSTEPNNAFEVTARVTLTVGGTLSFQWSQVSSSATNTTLQGGATMIVERIA